MALELRPTFTVDLTEACNIVAERLRVGLDARRVLTRWARVPGARTEASCAGTFVWIAMPNHQQRFWSPWLQVSVIPTQAGTQLFGRFSPRPAVWTAFALSYLFLCCVIFFSSMIGLAQLMLRYHAWGFWISGIALVVVGILWWISQTGKRLAEAQMRSLRESFDAALSP